MRARTFLLASTVAALGLSGTASATETGDWLIRAGVGTVQPKSDNGEIVDVDDGTSATINVTYMLSPNLGLDILGAWPFTHDLSLREGNADIGEVKHLPPTIGLQYRFQPHRPWQPYVGVGLNYTLFMDEETRGPLAGQSLSLDDSFGPAAQIGFDYMLDAGWLLNVDARYIDIDTDADLNGQRLETVEIDPWVFAITLGHRF